MAARLILGLLFARMLAGCVPPLPTPPSGAHEGEVPVPVPYPPPAAHVDIVPAPPSAMKNPAWIDGQWLWLGRRWWWEGGRWVDVKPGEVYAGPRVYRRTDGQLVWFKGTLKRPPTLKPAQSSAPSEEETVRP